MSDTPRTDAAVVWLPGGSDGEPHPYVPVHVAVELERENAELSDQLMRWFKAASPYATPGSLEEGLEQHRDITQSAPILSTSETPRTDAAAVLVSERARVELCEPEWTEVVDADFARQLERELAAAIRDRDARAREACTFEGRTGCSFRSHEGRSAEAAIYQHNAECKAVCDNRAANDLCAYRDKDGSMRYGRRRCHDCPIDWQIEWPRSLPHRA